MINRSLAGTSQHFLKNWGFAPNELGQSGSFPLDSGQLPLAAQSSHDLIIPWSSRLGCRRASQSIAVCTCKVSRPCSADSPVDAKWCATVASSPETASKLFSGDSVDGFVGHPQKEACWPARHADQTPYQITSQISRMNTISSTGTVCNLIEA